jgi:hypothetical protein
MLALYLVSLSPGIFQDNRWTELCRGHVTMETGQGRARVEVEVVDHAKPSLSSKPTPNQVQASKKKHFEL